MPNRIKQLTLDTRRQALSYAEMLKRPGHWEGRRHSALKELRETQSREARERTAGFNPSQKA